jgi:hypothetical protein
VELVNLEQTDHREAKADQHHQPPALTGVSHEEKKSDSEDDPTGGANSGDRGFRDLDDDHFTVVGEQVPLDVGAKIAGPTDP